MTMPLTLGSCFDRRSFAIGAGAGLMFFGAVSLGESAAPPDPEVVLTPRPAEVAGIDEPLVSLNGAWQFHPNPGPALLEPVANEDSWRSIEVPGHWFTQGFEVAKAVAAGYRRRFMIPKGWAGRRVKLRFDGVYSDAKVWVNGREAGGHVGGFTPFELDITGAVDFENENILALAVKRESPADLRMTTFGTLYARTPLGGITRKVTLFAVPEVHLRQLHLNTAFVPGSGDGVLEAEMTVVNESAAAAENLRAVIALRDPNGKGMTITPGEVDFGAVPAGKTVKRCLRIAVASPAQWDCEHPNLYMVTCRVSQGGRLRETVEQRFGFRQIEVDGRRLRVNGRPVKLRGVCRHEMDALTGRVNSPELSRRDVELFREANINLIRTSHYPPAEELLDACDELGMFVDDEAPFHHAEPVVTSAYRDLFLRQTAEMIERDRNRPSVLIWSLGNEAAWSPNFVASAEMVHRLDASRPRIIGMDGPNRFRQYPKDEIYESLEIASMHYPGMKSVDEWSRETKKPLLFDEYCHGNCYNREEVATDPGLRDQWVACLEEIWERMTEHEGCLGGAIWGGIDEVWHVPEGEERGWGRWGLLDSWHRPKPEYWHAKKVYSTVKALPVSLPEAGSADPFRLEVQNRHDFTNLEELEIRWTVGGQSGTAKANAAPHAKTVLEIRPDTPPKAGDRFRIEFHSPRGFLIDVYEWPMTTPAEKPERDPKQVRTGKLRLARDDKHIFIENGFSTWSFDRATGLLLSARAGEREILCGGPVLMLLPIGKSTANQTHTAQLTPWTATCADWVAESVTVAERDGGIEVLARGRYREADGSFRVHVGETGAVTVDYRFASLNKLEARQIGVVFDLPKYCDRLAWRRDARWTVYPEDHIGRPTGETRSKRPPQMPASPIAGRPAWPWAQDESPLGTNDFRATRTGIRRLSLTDEKGFGLEVVSDGAQAARAWLDGDRIRLLVADHARGTGETFLHTRGFSAAKGLTLEPGQIVEGTIRGFLKIPGAIANQ